MPNAVYNPENYVRVSLAAAEAAGLPPASITFEIVEGEEISDVAHA